MKQRKKLVIGVVGHSAAGKGTIVKILYLIADLYNLKITSLRFSSILLKRMCVNEAKTTKLQKEAQKMEQEGMDKGEGLGALSRTMKKYINEVDDVDIVLIDGVRWLTDRDMILSFPHHLLMGVEADEDIRHGRLSGRGEKVGERTKTLTQFRKEAKAPNEIHIDEIVVSADYNLDNNGLPTELIRMITSVWDDTFSEE